MTSKTCPNCGDLLAPLLSFTKMIDCESCGTTVVLDGEVLRQAGTRGEMLDLPGMLKLDDMFRTPNGVYIIVGHIRLNYGPGWWDEFWCVAPDDAGIWLSADEGDYVFERALPRRHWPTVTGKSVVFDGKDYQQSEKDDAICVGFRGQLPEEITIGEQHSYTNFISSDGAALSRETWIEHGQTQEAWFAGEWLDPWDIELRK